MQARIDQARFVPRYACIPWPAPASRSTAFGATLARARRTARAKRAEGVLKSAPAAPLEGPPPEIERELDAAALACQKLAAEGKELHFATSKDGRVSVELTDVSGQRLDVVGPVELFQLLKQA